MPTYARDQARSQDLEKGGGGGYFETVRSVQTTLTRILIDLESVSDGLSEIWDEMSRKFKGFFRPKLGDLQKKKKKRSSPKFRVIFRPKSKIQTFFPPKFRWSPKKKKKKKKVFAKIQGDFSSNFACSNVWVGALFVWGGLFSIFHRKSASKAQKTCDFAYFTSQWGGLEPPSPPLATLLLETKAKAKDTKKPRPRTALPRTDLLEAKDRNARGQGRRRQAEVV